MPFEFATAGKIVFGAGRIREAGLAARSLGSRAFVATGRDPARAGPLLALLGEAGVGTVPFAVDGEPTIAAVEAGVRLAREEGCDLAVGFGGGSALDAAKAVAALAPNPGPATDYLEIVGKALPLGVRPLPSLAMPTTSGTGSEVTRNAVLGSPAHGVKVSLRGPGLLPRIAILDPELTLGLPPALTASTGMDALSQLIEPFTCIRASPLTDGFCREGLARAARSLRRAFSHGEDAAAREDMALASLLGGLALANSGLGAVHGFASPIGGRFGAPHGAVCAALLAAVMEVNLRAVRRRGDPGGTEARYAEAARILTGRPGAAPEDGVGWVRGLVADLGMPGLAAHGVGLQHREALCAQAAAASSMKANPVALTPGELAEILALAA
jgi:alcohol dehydrogenase class IV